MNELVRNEEVRYVDLRGNPFCSADQLRNIRAQLDSMSKTMHEIDVTSTGPCPQILNFGRENSFILFWLENNVD